MREMMPRPRILPAGNTFRVIVSREGRVLAWDTKAARTFAVPAEEAHGKPFGVLIAAADPAVFEAELPGTDYGRMRELRGLVTASGTLDLWLMPLAKGTVLVIGAPAVGKPEDEIDPHTVELERLDQVREEAEVIMEELAHASAELVALQENARDLAAAREEIIDTSRLLRHDLSNVASALDMKLALPLDETKGGSARERDATMRRMLARVRVLLDRATVLQEEPPAPDKIDVVPMFRSAVDTARLLTDDRHPVLRADVPPGPLWVRCTAGLEQAFLNLVLNAVVHNPAAMPNVWVSAKVVSNEGQRLEVLISDDGPGLPARAREALERGEKAGGGEHGWGLLLARRLVERAGGTLEALDRVPSQPGRGTTFRLLLPLAS